MDQFFTRIAVMDIQNNYIYPVEKFELRMADNAMALSLLSDKIEYVIEQSGISRNKIAGIGIGMPGFVDPQQGLNYTFLPTKGESITGYITERTGLPCYIENDSDIVGLAELRFGAARNRRNAMVIIIDGAEIDDTGFPFRGDNGFAGEFSHIPFNNGKLCSCGKGLPRKQRRRCLLL